MVPINLLHLCYRPFQQYFNYDVNNHQHRHSATRVLNNIIYRRSFFPPSLQPTPSTPKLVNSRLKTGRICFQEPCPGSITSSRCVWSVSSWFYGPKATVIALCRTYCLQSIIEDFVISPWNTNKTGNFVNVPWKLWFLTKEETSTQRGWFHPDSIHSDK